MPPGAAGCVEMRSWADVGERVDGVASLTERRGDGRRRHVGDAGADARGGVARLLFGERIGAAPAAAERSELLQLCQGRLRVDHLVADGAAAVAVHFQDGRHLEAGARRQRAAEDEHRAEQTCTSHGNKMTQIRAFPI